MRLILAVIAITAVSTYALSDQEFTFIEETELDEPATPPTVFLQAKDAVAAMKKSGATNADCKDLAKTSCKEVEAEVNSDQKMLDKLKNGSQCDNLGQTAVRKAKSGLHRATSTHSKMKIKLEKSRNARVNFGTHTFSTLREGKCGQFFSSRSYRSAHHTYTTNVKLEVTWRARVTESKKALKNTEAAARREVQRCRCATKAARDLIWRTANARSRHSRQVKAHAKCKMMSCVLNGTPLASKACKSNLKRLRNKKLTRHTERVSGCGSSPAPRPNPSKPPTNKCAKWRAERSANSQIAKALKAEVRFGGGSTKLTSSGRKTLDGVARILNKYKWMTITVEGHSDAPKGTTCTRLTKGRAGATEKYLKGKGCRNPMSNPIGKCGVKRAIVIGNAGGRKSKPRGC